MTRLQERRPENRQSFDLRLVQGASVGGEPVTGRGLSFDTDRHCLATIRHMASLAPIAQLARKPVFDLKQADGVGGRTRVTLTW